MADDGAVKRLWASLVSRKNREENSVLPLSHDVSVE